MNILAQSMPVTLHRLIRLCLFVPWLTCSAGQAEDAHPSVDEAFLKRFCSDCHSPDSPEAGLDLSKLSRDLTDPEHRRRWIKVHDRLSSKEMPPRDSQQPDESERAAFVGSLATSLTAAEAAAAKGGDSPRLRRLTRGEYENTIRDLFHLPGIKLAETLPADGSAHGFDKHAAALDISHVNIARYLAAADHILDLAIATRPQPPTVRQRRISLVNRGGFVAHVVMNGDGVLLKEGQPDPEFPPAADQNHLDQGAHERWGSFENGASVGLFRHEDESFSPYYMEHVTIYPGVYRVRTSLWSFLWDKGAILPGRGTEAARLSVVQLTGDGRGGQHPSYVLGYFNAPVEGPQEHEVNVWLNHNEIIGFNTASLAPTANYSRKGRAMAFTGPGIVVDWLDIEGPLHDVWPPRGHTLLFGDLPIEEFQHERHPDVRPPRRLKVRQIGAGMNRPDPETGLWTVTSAAPIDDANRLLASFLPKLFRRPVADEVRLSYVAIVQERLAAGDAFETAMRVAYRTALCSPDFLYHVEPASDEDDGSIDEHAFACRISNLLWNSLPDAELAQHASRGDLRQPRVLHEQIERMLGDPRSRRFVEDFVGQWLKLNLIAANDPDSKLYPEFSAYLQDSMVSETREYFRELLDRDLDVSHLARSDFLMLNEKLATHYAIDGVFGTQIQRVPLPAGSPRGGFLTQAAILKITSNGTTTSPVPRGAFVLDRLLGQPPEPPPSNVAAIEPDVRGATTIREQLALHRDHAVCASCHRDIDPPGFALESFDVIGGYRNRYRTIGSGDPAERGRIDPFIGIGFKLGPEVDPTGELRSGQSFRNIQEYQSLLVADSDRLLRNLASQFVIYGTGREIRFSDRPVIDQIVSRTKAQGGGIRTLLHEVVASELFTGRQLAASRSPGSQENTKSWRNLIAHAGHVPSTTDDQHANARMLMTATLPAVEPIRIVDSPVDAATPMTVDINDDQTITLQVTGLFMPERVDDFKSLCEEIPEIVIQKIDFETAEVTFAIDAESVLFRGQNSEQMTERINNRIRQLSRHTLGVSTLSKLPREKWERLNFRIEGLDCMACSLAVYEILARSDGVEQATASFRDGQATAWIDPERTNRETLINVFKQRGVTLRENE